MKHQQFIRVGLITFLLYLLIPQFLLSQSLYNAVGAGQYTVPANVCAIYVEVIGAGGGGGYASDRGQTTGGGGGGAYAATKIFVNPGEIINYFIGAGGSGASGTNHGGDTWFYSTTTLLAQGGRGVANNNSSPGIGGSAANSIGAVRYSGGSGGSGSGKGDCHASGGGGSAGAPSGNGNSGANAQSGNVLWGCSGKTAGVGGQPRAGSWNTGVGGTGATNTTAGQGNVGNSGTGYGSGGGGGKRGSVAGITDSYIAKNGGSGTGGVIRITVYYQHTLNVSGLDALCQGSSTTLSATTSESATYEWSTGEVEASVIVTPQATATYSVTSTSTITGCSNISTHTINVTPSWSAPYNVSGEGVYCMGNTVNLNIMGASEGAIYEWMENSCSGPSLSSTSNYSFEPTQSTTLYVRAAAHGACDATSCVPVTITINQAGNSLSLNNDESTCPVRENNWVHFYNDGRLLLSVNSFGQNLGMVRAVSYVDPTSSSIPACGHEDNDQFSVSVMNRHWAVYTENEPTSFIQVRLPFYNSELINLVNLSQMNANPDDNLTEIDGLVLSKYQGPNHVNGNFFDNCQGMNGNEGTTLHTQTGNGLVSTYQPAVLSAQYAQYTLNNLSELWLHGSDKMTPLAILIDKIQVECEEQPSISFRADRISHVNRLEINGSEDGDVWRSIQTFYANDLSGNSPLLINVKDESNLTFKYYQVAVYDYASELLVNKIVASPCHFNISDLEVYPNPSNGAFQVIWNSEADDAYLEVISIEGKLIHQESVQKKGGVFLNHLSKGAYYLKVSLSNGDSVIERLILQ